MIVLVWLFSNDLPRSRGLAGLLLIILCGLALTPLAFHSTQAVDMAAHICIFILVAASYDLLLGYGGIVSFAHTMFFGIGAYGAALALEQRPDWGGLALGTFLALVVSFIVAGLIAVLSLRVRALFFSMITLAVASVFADLASRLTWLTGGEDGKSFAVPALLRPSFHLWPEPLLGVSITGKTLTYYGIFLASCLLFLCLLRLVNSPFGRVLLAIRENEFRAEALGYRTLYYRTSASIIAALVAAVAGVLMSLWLRFTGPDTTLSFDIMIDIVLMVVIGGQGSLYGAIIGATLILSAKTLLQPTLSGLQQNLAGLPLLPDLVNPDRWRLWLGALFILCVYLFPAGIVGKLRGHNKNHEYR